jgi:hypothetical protein
VIAENLVLKQQLIVLRRGRQRAPNLALSDRLICGLASLFLSPGRIRKVAIGLRPRRSWRFGPRNGPSKRSTNATAGSLGLRARPDNAPSVAPRSRSRESRALRRGGRSDLTRQARAFHSPPPEIAEYFHRENDEAAALIALPATSGTDPKLYHIG